VNENDNKDASSGVKKNIQERHGELREKYKTGATFGNS
jgi:hypothetical protein